MTGDSIQVQGQIGTIETISAIQANYLAVASNHPGTATVTQEDILIPILRDFIVKVRLVLVGVIVQERLLPT